MSKRSIEFNMSGYLINDTSCCLQLKPVREILNFKSGNMLGTRDLHSPKL